MFKNCLPEILLIVTSFICQIHFSQTKENFTLEKVAVVFRHGERTEITSLANTFLAKLTNVGKLQGFKLGIWLREQYPGLLKGYYDYEEIYARSSDVNRCVMTAETVLAGLYYPLDPKDKWSGKYDVAWSPIPVSNVPAKFDEMLFPNRELYCPVLMDILNESVKNPNKILLTNKIFSEYLTSKEEKQIKEIYKEALNYLDSNPTWGRLYSGPLLKNIVENFRANHTIMNLYAGHDVTIYFLIYVLDFEKKPTDISFLSTLIFELLVDNQTCNSYIQILFKNGPDSEAEVQKMKNCEELCPFEQFQQIIKPLIPGNWFEECREPYN